MSWPVTNTTRIHVTGDSITSDQTGSVGLWYGAPGGLIDQLMAAPGVAFTPTTGVAYVPVTLASPQIPYVTAPQRGRQQNVTGYGISGRRIAMLQTDLVNSIYVFNPAILIIELGTNDFSVGTATGGGSAFALSYAAVLDGVHTNLPACKILCMSIPVRDERTVAGPHFIDATDTWQGNADIQTLCSARSTYCEYVDINGPALAYEVANNTTPAGGVTPALLTSDSIHPTTLGKVMMANATMPHFTFS